MSIINSIITVESLWNVMTQKEHRDFCSMLSKEDALTQIKAICVDKVYDGTYTFNIKNVDGVFKNACSWNSMEYLCQNLLIRKLNQNIMRAYRLKVVDRRKIINQLRQILKYKIPIEVLRKDVHHFFESVKPSKVIELLKSDGRITQQTQELIEQLLSQTTGMGAQGLPRGLSISSSLSEFYMRKFDYEFIRYDGMLLYCRFVDDMLFVCTSYVNVEDIQQKVDNAFLRLDLIENTKKKQTLSSSDLEAGQTFDFLGYKFEGKRTIGIADAKLNKIKTRIVISFKQYLKNKDGQLLVERMRYLSCVSSIENSALKNIRIGLPSNYVALNDDNSLNELDTFYRGLISCKKGTFGRDLQSLLSTDVALKRQLQSVNFKNSFFNRRKVNVTASRIHQINECWHE